MGKGWAVGVVGWIGLVAVAGGLLGDVYQWTYDQLALGPGWRGHLFANRTGLEVEGLEVLIPEPGRSQALAVGGMLRQVQEGDGIPRVVLTGRGAPGGLILLALPEHLTPCQAAWITQTGRIPINLELPIPRVTVEELFPNFMVFLIEAEVPHILPYPEPVFFHAGVVPIWPEDLDPDALRMWEGYACLVRLDARGSFSPVGEEIVGWTWVWEDGLVQEGPVVVRGFARPGLYRVRLVVTDAAGRDQVLHRLVEARVGENFSDEPVFSIKPLPSQEQEKPVFGKDPLDDMKLAR